MSARTWSFYDPETGLFNNRSFSGPAHALEANTPAGAVAIEGDFDHLSQRVNLDGLDEIASIDPGLDGAKEKSSLIKPQLVIEYQPPQPSDDYEWDEHMRRWRVKIEVAEREQRINLAKGQLRALDASHLRALDEVIANPQDKEAAARLVNIRSQKAALREQLT